MGTIGMETIDMASIVRNFHDKSSGQGLQQRQAQCLHIPILRGACTHSLWPTSRDPLEGPPGSRNHLENCVSHSAGLGNGPIAPGKLPITERKKEEDEEPMYKMLQNICK